MPVLNQGDSLWAGRQPRPFRAHESSRSGALRRCTLGHSRTFAALPARLSQLCGGAGPPAENTTAAPSGNATVGRMDACAQCWCARGGPCLPTSTPCPSCVRPAGRACSDHCCTTWSGCRPPARLRAQGRSAHGLEGGQRSRPALQGGEPVSRARPAREDRALPCRSCRLPWPCHALPCPALPCPARARAPRVREGEDFGGRARVKE